VKFVVLYFTTLLRQKITPDAPICPKGLQGVIEWVRMMCCVNQEAISLNHCLKSEVHVCFVTSLSSINSY